jgi:hypothetical protein
MKIIIIMLVLKHGEVQWLSLNRGTLSQLSQCVCCRNVECLCIQHSSCSLMSGYRKANRSSLASRARDVAVHHRNQTGLGMNLASCPVCTGGLLPVLKWPGFQSDHSLPSSTKFKNV